MGERVSAYGQPSLPGSLMQRLAVVGEETPSAADGQSSGATSGRPDRGARTAVSFGLGVLAATVVGGIALAALSMVAPEPALSDRNPPLHDTIAAASPVALPLTDAALAPPPEAEPDVFDMVIDRGQGAPVPFGLRLTGTDSGSVAIVLRDVPPAAQLSRGERWDGSTWVLQGADLGDLTVTLQHGTPDAFDLRIDIMVAPGMATTTAAVAKVRLTGPPAAETAVAAVDEQTQPPAKIAEASATVETAPPAQVPPAGPTTDAASVEKATPPQRRPPPTTATTSARAAPVAVPQPRPWPEGASALGATSREWDRQVWWQMPPPAWSPFQDPPTQR
jgi:hypothetical protein